MKPSYFSVYRESKHSTDSFFYPVQKKNSMSWSLPLDFTRHTFSLPKDIARTTQLLFSTNIISVMGIFSGIHISFLFEYETPKVIKVKNVPMGILRLVLQTTMILFVVLYQLWYARGYQEFLDVDASVGTKVKGFSM